MYSLVADNICDDWCISSHLAIIVGGWIVWIDWIPSIQSNVMMSVIITAPTSATIVVIHFLLLLFLAYVETLILSFVLVLILDQP